MKESLTKKEAVELFSSTKKTLKTLDKTFAKSATEFIVKSEEKGMYSLYTSDNYYTPVCTSDDVYKTFCGLLYFEYGVGKKDVMPAWASYGQVVEDSWQGIEKDIEVSVSPFKSVNKALDNGATLYYQKESDSEQNTFAITNPYNENFANKSVVRASTFSRGLNEVESIASLCLSSCEQTK